MVYIFFTSPCSLDTRTLDSLEWPIITNDSNRQAATSCYLVNEMPAELKQQSPTAITNVGWFRLQSVAICIAKHFREFRLL